jgi:hypothetical protein
MTSPDLKALCVIINIDGNFEDFIPIYLDGKIIACVKDSSITAFEVEPGLHYVMSQLDNEATKYLSFLPGKTYFIRMGAIDVPMFDGVKFTLIDRASANAIIKEFGAILKHTGLDPTEKYKDMDKKDYKEEIEEYKEWSAENVKDAEDELNYPGY